MVIVNFLKKFIDGYKKGEINNSFKTWYNETIIGFEKGALNMISVGVAIATAGIIVGAVSTGKSYR